MALINHNISSANDGLGDQLRTAFSNQNSMNSELYTETGKLRTDLIAAATGASGKSIVPSSPAPTGTGVQSYTATQAGTYTNYGGVVVNTNSFAIISRDAAGAFTISQTPLDISTKVNVSDVINTLASTETTKPLSAAQGKVLKDTIDAKDAKIKPFINQAYATVDTQVSSLGKIWYNNAETAIGDLPGTSTKWVELLSGYANIELMDIYPLSVEENSNGFYFYDTGVFTSNASFKSIKASIDPLNDYFVSSMLFGGATALAVYYTSAGVYISHEKKGNDSTIQYYDREKLNTPSNAAFVGLTSYSETNFAVISTVSNLEDINERITAIETNNISSEFSDFEYINYFDCVWEVGSYLSTLGTPVTFENLSYTKNYIPVNTLYQYRLLCAGTTIIWYDLEKNYIGYLGEGSDGFEVKTITPPSNAAFMRINQVNSVKEDLIVYISGKKSFSNLIITKSQIIDLSESDTLNSITDGKQESVNTIRSISEDINFNDYLIQGNVLVSGDSTIAEWLGGSAISSIIKATGTVTNISAGGNTINQQLVSYTGLTTELKSSLNYAFVQIGLNDLEHTESAFTAIKRLQNYINSIKLNSPNAKIIIGEMLPCKQRLIDYLGEINGDISFQKWRKMNYVFSQKGILNTNEVANLHTYNLSDGNGNLASIYDTGDGIHENTAGRKLIAYSWISAYLSI